MAKRTDVYTLKTDTGDSVKDIKKLDDSLQNLKKSASETNKVMSDKNASSFEKQLEDLNRQIDSGEMNFQQMTKAIKDYQTIAFKAGATSPVGAKAIKQAADLRDRLADLDSRTRQLSSDYAKMDAALQGASAAMAGFTAFQGVSALMGDENEELLETITKLQAATSTLTAIQQVRLALNKDSALVQQIQILRTKLQTKETLAQTTATKLANMATSEGTKAFKLLRGAILATGIGALIASVGYLVANFDKLKNAITGVSQSQRIMNDVTNTALDNAAEELSASDRLSKKLNDETLTREQKVQAVKDLQAEYPDLLANVDAEKDGIDAVNKALELNTKLLTLKAKQEAIAELRVEEFKKQIQEQADAQTGANVGFLEYAGSIMTSVNAQDVANARSAKTIKSAQEQVNVLDELDESLNKQIELLKSQGAEYGATEKAAEKTTGKQKEMISQLRTIQDLTLELEGDTLEKALEQNRLFYERKKEDTLANEQIIQSEKEQLIELFAQQEAQKRQELFDQYGVQELELRKAPILEVGKTAQDMEIQRTMTMRTESQERIRLSDEEKDAMVKNFNQYTGIVTDGLQSLNNLNDLVTTIQLERAEGNEAKQEQIQKKSFERNKKIQIAMATIQGIQGVVNALTAASVLPEPFGSIQKGIQAAVVATSTAANIAKIKATKFQGGGSVSAGGGGGIQGATASQFSIGDDTSSSQTLLNQDGTQQGGTQPQKVYVTETDISNTQQAVNQINVRSTF